MQYMYTTNRSFFSLFIKQRRYVIADTNENHFQPTHLRLGKENFTAFCVMNGIFVQHTSLQHRQKILRS